MKSKSHLGSEVAGVPHSSPTPCLAANAAALMASKSNDRLTHKFRARQLLFRRNPVERFQRPRGETSSNHLRDPSATAQTTASVFFQHPNVITLLSLGDPSMLVLLIDIT